MHASSLNRPLIPNAGNIGLSLTVASNSNTYDGLRHAIQAEDLVRAREIIVDGHLDPNAKFTFQEKADSLFNNGKRMMSAEITMVWQETPLDMAIATGNLAMVKLLVENGANIETVSSHFRSNALFTAIAMKKEAIAFYLIEQNADVKFV